MNFGINLIFQINPFFPDDQKVKAKFKYLESEKSFQDEIKSIFYHFKRVFIETNKTNFWKVKARL